ncbi:hypothetical protein Tco_0523437 [Tanacetum coccineum]
MSRPPVPDMYYMPEYISEYGTGIQVQTQLESDVTMARRRHGNHADMQFVFIPQTTLWRMYHIAVLTGALKNRRNIQKLPEQEFTSTVQTQLESDVTMARRRHGNHADMQFVFIPQTKPDTLAHVSGPLVCQSRSTSMTSLIRSLSYSHAGVWSWGHTRGETDACLSVCRYHTAVLTGALKNRWNIQKLPEQFTSIVRNDDVALLFGDEDSCCEDDD